MKNAGLEMRSAAQIIDRSALGFDFTLTSSMNANKLLSLGSTPPQIGIDELGHRRAIRFAACGRSRSPAGTTRTRTASSRTTPIRHTNEVFVGEPDTIFRGYAEPRYLTALTPGIDLFNRKLRIQTLFDYRGGNKWYNNTERIRCVSRQNCNGLMNPNASFEEQAMVVATLDDPSKTLDGFLQPGAFVKWREVSATLTLPERMATRAARPQREPRVLRP